MSRHEVWTLVFAFVAGAVLTFFAFDIFLGALIR
jgi:preprotein translocase subunit SecE